MQNWSDWSPWILFKYFHASPKTNNCKPVVIGPFYIFFSSFSQIKYSFNSTLTRAFGIFFLMNIQILWRNIKLHTKEEPKITQKASLASKKVPKCILFQGFNVYKRFFREPFQVNTEKLNKKRGDKVCLKEFDNQIVCLSCSLFVKKSFFTSSSKQNSIFHAKQVSTQENIFLKLNVHLMIWIYVSVKKSSRTFRLWLLFWYLRAVANNNRNSSTFKLVRRSKIFVLEFTKKI